ncbi:transcription factor bHLH57-like [Typha angustifolia]|uniref:transcription factor bHLH57-like n=1 Tax=Typha angustifolia TaxID=59011 RepID=UPI003C309740
MERLQGPINPFLVGEEMISSGSLITGHHQQMPFLQLLQGAIFEAGEVAEQEESHFQLLLRLQNNHQSRDPTAESCITQEGLLTAKPTTSREAKKRKRSRSLATKKSTETETQRMTHIAVERNRRRLMNDHLSTLRSLVPPSFVLRGDQASIIGGAIDFVKEMEQLLVSLQAEKQVRGATASGVVDGFFVSPQYTSYSQRKCRAGIKREVEVVVEEVDVEASMVQGHVNLKVAGRRRPGQLVRAIAAMEGLGLSVLHLSITSLDQSAIFYSLNLKMEEDCKLGSADEIATAVHQIFTYSSACC